MPRHAETRVLPYTPAQMFDLVADIRRYPEFLPWVAAVRVRSDSEIETIADLVVGFRALKERFTSKVVKARPSSVHVDYLDGPLKYLRNDWTFRPAEGGGTALDFCVDFAFRSRIFEALAGQMFDLALRRMIGAFEARAGVLYGAAGSGADSSGVGGSGISRSSATSAA